MLSTPRSERFGVRSKSLLFLLALLFLQCSHSYAEGVPTKSPLPSSKSSTEDCSEIRKELDEILSVLEQNSEQESKTFKSDEKLWTSDKQLSISESQTLTKDKKTFKSDEESARIIKKLSLDLEDLQKSSNQKLKEQTKRIKLLTSGTHGLIITAVSGTVLGLLIGTQLK